MIFKSDIVNKTILLFIIKFIGIFCLLYFGTLAVIGLSTPESYYSPFVAKYLDYVNFLRSSLLHVSQALLSLFNFNTTFTDKYTLMSSHGGIRMVYSCVGYGVMSFWAAFVVANKGGWRKKIVWLLAGWLLLCIINVLRISILLVAINKSWEMPLGWDHHTWFNIIAYLLIFLLIYFYDRSSKILYTKSDYPKHS